MPFSADTFTHLFDWEKDPQRQDKIVNARLEAELDGIDTGLSQAAVRLTAVEGQVANNAVTNAKLADMAQGTIKGRASGAGTGDPTDLTGTQATAILDAFTASAKGLAPASGGGTTSFLRADGSWAAPVDKAAVFTVATLPVSPGIGARACVTDLSAGTFGNIAVGGGATFRPVIFDGANWIVG